jgi:hypothetical protein
MAIFRGLRHGEAYICWLCAEHKKRNAPGPLRQPSCQREVVRTGGSLPYG